MEGTELKDGARIARIDALRGFALFGILYAHVTIWFTGSALPNQIYQQFTDTPSQIAIAIFGVLVLGKFYTIFSFLFGFSFYQQNVNRPNHATYLNRILVLGIFGLLHHLIWSGDILLIYALLAFCLVFLNRLSNKSILALALLLIFNLPGQVLNLLDPVQTSKVNLPMTQEAERYVHMINSGHLKEMVQYNASVLLPKFLFQLKSGRLFITLGFFLLGLLAARKKLVENFQPQFFQTVRRYSLAAALSLLCVAGVLVLCGIVSFPTFNYAPQYRWILQAMYDSFNLSVSLFYMSAVMLQYHSRKLPLLTWLQPAGRMPLTIYLTQTIIGIFLFYHLGLGLFRFTSPAHNALMVIPIFAFQVWLSKFWLSRFEYGPVEWLWRCLAESRWIQIRKRMLS
jgi:uncharacterized protein